MNDDDTTPLFSGIGDTVTAPELETRTCPECGEQITANASGKNGVGWRMSLHRRQKHGVAGQGKSKPKPGAPTEEEFAERPVLSVIRAAASEVGGRGTKRAPTATELGKAGGQGLALTTIAVASFMVETDTAIPEGPEGEAMRSELVDYLSLDMNSAVTVMSPLGRAFAGTSANQKYGRQIVDNVDVLSSVADLAMLAMHWRRYLRMRAQPAGGPGGATVTPLFAVPSESPVTTAPAAGTTTAGPQSGHVVSAEDVARMRSQS